ncbi:MAG: type I secretion C-terminal target domain-containing protein [Gammaproteobacteria bacterium]|nr:type I secretion C-terminal target domain-containing protein [Gammaproteobacteria bacterium]
MSVGSLPSGITASAYNPVTGVMTLTGSATLADYQTAIRAIQYSNDGSTVNTSRSISVVVNDGDVDSNVATTNVSINLIPTVTIDDVSVQEPSSGTTTLTFTVSVDEAPVGTPLTFDVDTSDISAAAGSDYVAVATTGSIAVGANTTTVVVTINSDADVFESDETFSVDLTGFNKTVNFAPGAHTISGGVQGIGTIGADNGPPIAVDDSYVTNVDAPLVIGNALVNDTLVDNAVVDVSGWGAPVGGVYSFAGVNGTVEYDSNTGDFTFTPTGGYSGPASFSYTLVDDDGETDTATVSVNVSAVGVNAPVVSNVPDVAYTENDAATNILNGVNISDVDSTGLSSVVVTLGGYISGQDALSFVTAGTSVTSSVSSSGGVWKLTLSGGTDINEYISVLDTLTYENTSDNPSTAARTVTVEAFDETYANLFGADAGTIAITAVNDAPTVYDNAVYTLGGSNDNALGITIPTDVDDDDNLLVITVTGLPSAGLGTVMMADGVTPVTNGQVLTLAELNSLVFDSAVGTGIGTFTYSVSDGEYTEVATTTINVGDTAPDVGTVYEGALPGGTNEPAGATTTATGNLFANDANAGSAIGSIDFDPGTGSVNYTPTGGVITVDTPLGFLTVYADNSTPGFSAGDYIYVLDTAETNDPPAGATDLETSEAFTYNFTNGIGFSDTLTITVVDDAPVANDLSQDIPESEEYVFNVVLTLDVSTSMNATVGGGPDTRLSLAKESLASLAQEYFNQSTQVSVTVLTFANGAHFVGTYTDYASAEAAINALTDVNGTAYSNDLLVQYETGSGIPGDPDGDTNANLTNATSYVDPTRMIEHVLTNDIAAQNPADDVQNISYFLSDGAITADTGVDLFANGFDTFVNNNSVDSYSVGIGDGLPGDLSDLNYIHNIDSLGRGHGHVDDALIVTDVSELESELLSTVPTAFGGNITASGSISNVQFGADGGYVQSVTIELGGSPETFTYDGSTVTVPAGLIATVVVSGSTIELNADDGFAYGTFTFDFSDGSYTMSAPNGIAPATFDFDYTIIDVDGDTADATATLNIVDDSPDAKDDLHSVSAYQSAEGNVVTAIGTDGGPSFGNDFTPFASQGGGVDKVVDNAVVNGFTYKGATITLDSGDITIAPGTPPAGGSENLAINDTTNFSTSNISLSSTAGVGFDANGAGVSGGRANATMDDNDAGTPLIVTFDNTDLPYGADNIMLGVSDYQLANTDGLTIVINYADGSTSDTINVTAQDDNNTETVDLSAYSGVSSLEISYYDQGGWDAQLSNVAFDPTAAPDVITPSGGTYGADISWVYNVEQDLDGNDVFEAVVTDTSGDGAVFTMRSNGYYNYEPGGSVTVSTTTVNITSAANVTASDLTLSGFDNTGAPANLLYSVDGVTIEGGASDDRIDDGETLTIDFTEKGGNTNGVQNVQFNLTSAGAAEEVVYTIYGLDGTTVLGTETSGDDPFTISAADYAVIGRIDFTALDAGTWVRLQGITYDEITSPIPTNFDPVVVDYDLTDTDGQTDTAQLSIYTIDNTITGTAGVDNIVGGALNDAIVGDDGDDTLSGAAGHDTLSGGAGDDTLDGGSGEDYLSGGDGVDTLSGGADDDHLTGDAGDDIVDGGTGDDIVQGGTGDDQLFGGAGADILEGEDGADVLYGGAGDDDLRGGEDVDTLYGNDGADLLSGGGDADNLYGGLGDDTLLGGGGIDLMIGGEGDDTMTGGLEGDTFRFMSGDEGSVGTPAIDTITDFTVGPGGDVLDLSDLLQGESDGDIPGLADYLHFEKVGNDTVISVDATGTDPQTNATQQIVLSDVDLTAGGTLTDQDILNSLLSNNNLNTDT